MKKALTGILAMLALQSCSGQAQYNEVNETNANQDTMQTLHDFEAQTLVGESFDFSSLKGKRVLIVNTASECGYTPQYKGLQELYEKYGGENFTIIGFPSNDFGGQEPGSSEEIQAFCEKNYGVSFSMMDKVSVKGEDKHAIYEWLTAKERNGRREIEVKWNFNKFLVDENGKWFAYFPSDIKPMDERIVSFAKGEQMR